MKKNWPLSLVGLLLLGASCAPTTPTTNPTTNVSEITNGAASTAAVDEVAVEAAVEDKTDVTTTVTPIADMTTEASTAPTYTGNRLAGTVTPYLEFTQSDYDQAVAAGSTIVLDFYANWCPICRAEEPALFSSFDTLNDPTVVGFRVNYNDDDTDDAEDALANQFGVTYQHTKVILRSGQVELKTQNTWDETSLAEALAAL